jgi:septal ring-binding cell division protein DamX
VFILITGSGSSIKASQNQQTNKVESRDFDEDNDFAVSQNVGADEINRANNVLAMSPATAGRLKTTFSFQEQHKWIKKRAETSLTLQLFASSSQKAVEEYVSKHDALNELHMFHSTKNDGKWYTVIYGSYSNMNEANVGIKELPPILGVLQPWVRSFSEVQEEIYKPS